MPGDRPHQERTVSTYCYQCVAGPDLLKVRIEDGVATEIAPNFDAANNSSGRRQGLRQGLRARAEGLQSAPHPLSDEADQPEEGPRRGSGLRAHLLGRGARSRRGQAQRGARGRASLDESGYPRVAASFGGGGTPTAYMGTLPAFLAAWGPVDMSFGSGQGVKCTHSEHLYGELWHRAFTVSPDTPLCEYLVSFGANVEASGGVCGVKRHADARKRGMKRVQIEPHLSVTGACSAEWIPIKPKTDVAFLFAMIHVLLHEHAREPARSAVPEEPHLVALSGRARTASSCAIRTRANRWSSTPQAGGRCRSTRTGIDPALEGVFTVDGVEVGAGRGGHRSPCGRRRVRPSRISSRM